MERLIKTLLPITGILCGCMTVFFAPSYAKDDTTGQGYDSGTFREITPNAGPRVSNGSDVFITADFIYWKANMEGIAYAIDGLGSTGNNPPPRGRIRQPDFDYQPGFKVGLGLNLNHDGWDVYAQYTWRNMGHTRETTTAEVSTSTLGSTWDIFFQNGNFLNQSINLTFASGDWRMTLNVIDVELGRNFFISQYLTLRPFAGFKGTWQNQSYIVRYTTVPSVTVPAGIINEFRMGQHEDYWGIGIRAGLNTAWHFTKRWSVFGNLALTALWTDYDVRRRDRNLNSTQTVAQITFNTRNDFNTIKPILELALGLRWETWFYDDDYHISFQAGWEEQVWWSRNQFIRVFEESAHGDLTFQGLTLRGRFDF